jgi:hypothetical protein
MNQGYMNIRICSTGQVTEMVPDVARAMISSGMAEEVGPAKKPETMAVAPSAERAVAPAQNPANKSASSRRRVG